MDATSARLTTMVQDAHAPKFLWLFFTILLTAWPTLTFAQQRNEDDLISVYATNVRVRQVLTAVAGITERNLVIGPTLTETRVSIHENFSVPELFFTGVAEKLPAVVIPYEGTIVIRDKCTPVPTTLLTNNRTEKISLNFQHSSTEYIFGILHHFYDGDIDGALPTTDALLPLPVSLRLHDVTERMAWNALAIASGVDIVQSKNNLPVRREIPATGQCKLVREKLALELKQFPPITGAKKDSCRGLPADAAENKGIHLCEPLETYPLSSLVARGFVTYRNNNVALVESSLDGLLYNLRVGNWIGYNFGLVSKITDEGIEIKELQEDETGEWVEIQKLIRYYR